MAKYEEICVNGKRYLKHRYVWEETHGKIPKGYEVHHIDKNTHNNNIDNLVLISVHEHRKLHSKDQVGRKHSLHTKEKIRQKALGRKVSDSTRQRMSQSNTTKKPIYCIEKDMVFESIAEAAKFFNVDRRSIYGCIAGSQKTCGGGLHFTLRKGDKDG